MKRYRSSLSGIEASPFDDIYGAGMKREDLLNPDGTLKTLRMKGLLKMRLEY